jgi:hypothetical protein
MRYGSFARGTASNERTIVEFDIVSVVADVTEALELNDIPYVIGGSLASSYHGEPRSTHDADLGARIGLRKLPLLHRDLSDRFAFEIEAAADSVRRFDMFSLIHYETGLKVDIFVAGPGRRFDVEFERRAVGPLRPGVDAPHAFLLSAEDTVLRKLEWYRIGGERSEKQWRDVTQVLAVQGDKIDIAYLREWAESLAIADLLEEALEEAAEET